MGRVLLATGRYADAHDRLQSSADRARDRVYELLAGDAALRAGDSEKALASWLRGTRTVDQRIGWAERLATAAVVGEKVSSSAIAQRLLERTLTAGALTPRQRADLHTARARLHDNVGDFSSSVEARRAALREMPADDEARLGLVGALVNAGRADEALLESEPMLARAEAWRARELRGRIHLQRCEPDRAIAEFRAALEAPRQGSRWHVLLRLLGDAYWASGQTDRAIDAWTEYLAYRPNHQPTRARLRRAGEASAPPECVPAPSAE